MTIVIQDEPAIIKWLTLSEDSLKKIDNIELATLKIHIVLEDALKFLLSKRLFVNENYFDDKHIEFSKLVEIAVAGMNNPHLLGALRSLNKARNKISHRLASSEVLKHLKNFVFEVAYMQGKIFDFAINSIN
jgi:hypothetical protein